jgi:hypothetical protein
MADPIDLAILVPYRKHDRAGNAYNVHTITAASATAMIDAAVASGQSRSINPSLSPERCVDILRRAIAHREPSDPIDPLPARNIAKVCKQGALAKMIGSRS